MKNISIVGLRKYNNLTQREMANKLEQGYSTYAQKEQGFRAWTLNDFVKVSALYNVNVHEIDEFQELLAKEFEKLDG